MFNIRTMTENRACFVDVLRSNSEEFEDFIKKMNIDSYKVEYTHIEQVTFCLHNLTPEEHEIVKKHDKVVEMFEDFKVKLDLNTCKSSVSQI